MSTLACFLNPFTWIFLAFYSEIVSIFVAEICVLYAVELWNLFHSVILSFYWGIESIVVERYLWPMIVNSCYICCCRLHYVYVNLSFWFCCKMINILIFFGVGALIVLEFSFSNPL